MKAIVELYQEGKNWRWRIKDASNKRIIGASTEGYSKRSNAVKNLCRLTWLCLDDEFDFMDGKDILKTEG